MKIYRIIWSENAIFSLQAINEYIGNSSLKAANMVVSGIIDSIEKLEKQPYLFQEDEFIKNNSGSVRRLFKWSYRIVYEVGSETVEIIDIIHTSRAPKK